MFLLAISIVVIVVGIVVAGFFVWLDATPSKDLTDLPLDPMKIDPTEARIILSEGLSLNHDDAIRATWHYAQIATGLEWESKGKFLRWFTSLDEDRAMKVSHAILILVENDRSVLDGEMDLLESRLDAIIEMEASAKKAYQPSEKEINFDKRLAPLRAVSPRPRKKTS